MYYQTAQMQNVQRHHNPTTATNFTNHPNDYSSTDSEAEAQINTNSWQQVPGEKRKRKRLKTLPSTNKANLVAHPNKFSLLENQNTENRNDQTHDVQTETLPKPPPIFVHGVMDYAKMILALSDVAETEQYTTKSLANNMVKINANTSDTYRKLITFMKTSNIVHHTYQLKEDKAYRVVIRNLHPTMPVGEIKELIEQNGFPVRSVSNIRHSKTKDPLPLFYVDLEPARNNKDIYSLKFLNNQVITVEPPHNKTSIVQCTRCQRYNHTKTYCTLPFACVKCGGQHDTKVCKKSKDLPATCALCGGNHTANYRGCEVYTKLKQHSGRVSHLKERASQQHAMKLQTTESTNTAFSPQQFPQKTYCQAVTTGLQVPQLTEHMSLSKFLEEFKTMFTQLIQQNNMVISMLGTVINKLVP